MSADVRRLLNFGHTHRTQRILQSEPSNMSSVKHKETVNQNIMKIQDIKRNHYFLLILHNGYIIDYVTTSLAS